MTDPIIEQDRILGEIVRRLVEAFRPERIYLFGSKARGDENPDSDYDIMMIVGESDAPGYRRDQEAYRALRDVDAPKDVLVWTHREFFSRAHLPASFSSTILREGKLLYAA